MNTHPNEDTMKDNNVVSNNVNNNGPKTRTRFGREASGLGMDINERQIKTRKLRMIPLITGSLSTLLALLMGGEELLVRVIVTIIAIVSAIICIVLFFTEIYFNRRYKINGHEYVDLGLPTGIKWATCNVGASSPEDYGKYYAWGETTTKTEYNRSNSKTEGKSINDIKGDSRYDAAKANWGGSWRLPTKAELKELVENCTWSWTTQGGEKGYKVTGPNGNSIFLPAAGHRVGTTLFSTEENGYYWSSTPYESGADRAYNLYFNSGYLNVDWSLRSYGRSVRPVSE